MAEFASNGKGNAALTTGIIGTALGALNTGGLGNILNNTTNGGCSEDHYVNRYELGMQNTINEKDARIAMLEADQRTDGKILELYNYVNGVDKAIGKEIATLAAGQAVINQKVTDNIAFLDNKIDTTYDKLKCYVDATFVPGEIKLPLDSICPQAMPMCATTITSK